MKKISLLILSVFLVVALAAQGGWYYAAAAGGGASAFTLVNSAQSEPATSGTTATVQLTGVTAGNLIVIVATWELGPGDSISGISDGTSSFTASTESKASHDNPTQVWYLLSSVASGTVTYTVTYSPDADFQTSVIALEFDYGGTATYVTGASGFGNTGTSLTTGNATNSGTHRLNVGGFGSYGNSITASTIGGVSATLYPASDPSLKCRAFYNAEQLSGENAAATMDGSNVWTLSLACFAAN